jgi:hypothetical protein
MQGVETAVIAACRRHPDRLRGGERPCGGRRVFAWFLIIALELQLAAVIQQIVFLRRLAREAGHRFQISIAIVSSLVLLTIGLLALINIIFHIGPF